jgi:hypothetical protein
LQQCRGVRSPGNLGRPSLLAPDRKEIDRESELGSTGRVVNAICSVTSSH